MAIFALKQTVDFYLNQDTPHNTTNEVTTSAILLPTNSLYLKPTYLHETLAKD